MTGADDHAANRFPDATPFLSPQRTGAAQEVGTGQEIGTGQEVTKVHRLLNRLGLAVPLVVLITALGVVAPYYVLQTRPQIEADIQARQSAAADRVEGMVRGMVGTVDALLLTMRDWGRNGALDPIDPRAFNKVMVPIIEQHAIVSSVHLASDDGREILLLRTPEGWKNRLTDVAANGTRQRWITWRDVRTRTADQWLEQDYDPRRRPWFTGALDTPAGDIHWTPPNIFVTTQDPGITASVHWMDPTSGRRFVVAFDVLLTDLSRFTATLDLGGQGQVALVASDGRVLGLPGDARFVAEQARKEAVLRTPEDLHLGVLAAALRLAMPSPSGGQSLTVPAQEAGSDQDWRADLRSLTVHNQSLRIATLLPASDLRSLPTRVVLTVGAVLTSIALAAMLFALGLVHRVRRPIAQAVMEVERNRQAAEARTRRQAAGAEIAARLQAARTPAALGRILLSALAPRLDLGQAMIGLWDEETASLITLARYAGTGAGVGEGMEADGRTPARGALLAQCAADRRAMVLDVPREDYFFVRSGLGDSAPCQVLILPVQARGRLFAVMELASLRPFTDDDRRFLADLEATIAMSLDILVLAERSARLLAQSTATEDRNRLILEAIDTGIWGIGPDGRTSFVNRSALDLLGYGEEGDMVGKPARPLIQGANPANSPGSDRCPILLTLRDGEPQADPDARFWRKDGTTVAVSYTTTAIVRGGSVVGVVVVFSPTAPAPARQGDPPPCA